jgi:hypothetical protein
MLAKHVNIKFCISLHISPSETLQLLEVAYAKVAREKMQVYK